MRKRYEDMSGRELQETTVRYLGQLLQHLINIDEAITQNNNVVKKNQSNSNESKLNDLIYEWFKDDPQDFKGYETMWGHRQFEKWVGNKVDLDKLGCWKRVVSHRICDTQDLTIVNGKFVRK